MGPILIPLKAVANSNGTRIWAWMWWKGANSLLYTPELTESHSFCMHCLLERLLKALVKELQWYSVFSTWPANTSRCYRTEWHMNKRLEAIVQHHRTHEIKFSPRFMTVQSHQSVNEVIAYNKQGQNLVCGFHKFKVKKKKGGWRQLFRESWILKSMNSSSVKENGV